MGDGAADLVVRFGGRPGHAGGDHHRVGADGRGGIAGLELSDRRGRDLDEVRPTGRRVELDLGILREPSIVEREQDPGVIIDEHRRFELAPGHVQLDHDRPGRGGPEAVDVHFTGDGDLPAGAEGAVGPRGEVRRAGEAIPGAAGADRHLVGADARAESRRLDVVGLAGGGQEPDRAVQAPAAVVVAGDQRLLGVVEIEEAIEVRAGRRDHVDGEVSVQRGRDPEGVDLARGGDGALRACRIHRTRAGSAGHW